MLPQESILIPRKAHLQRLAFQKIPWLWLALGASLAGFLFFDRLPALLHWPVRLVCLATLAYLVFALARLILRIKFERKKALFSLMLGALVYATIHLFCSIFIKVMSAKDDRLATRAVTALADVQKIGIKAMMDGSSYEMYDRETGWLPRPGHHGDGVEISAQGLRSLKEYTVPAPDPTKRILCLGDSFTYGHSVSDRETYPYHAEQILPGTEWINLGISGGCMTQNLIQYRKAGRSFGGKYVVIGFMTDDAKRTVNCFRPFLTQFNPFTKPFAKFSDGKFSIEPNPYQSISDFQKLLDNEKTEIENLIKIDYLTWSKQEVTRNPVLRTGKYIYESMHLEQNWNHLLNIRVSKKRSLAKARLEKKAAIADSSAKVEDPYGRMIWDEEEERWTKKTGSSDPYGEAIWSPSSLGFNALTRVFDLLNDEITADGRVPLIVIIPGPLDVENHIRNYPRVYDSLVQHLKAKGYEYFDFLDLLMARHPGEGAAETIFTQMHYAGPVNKELAEAIIAKLHLQ